MSVPEFGLKRKYTYQDYLRWSDDERWELIDGVPYAISLAPFDVCSIKIYSKRV
ncbi:hypothetical protein [Aneurinibacillus uraniidurans]|uniref:hypothetical protein n=1 Tax=Aneurinibacillus uraniidurans TaxID=2966586 RepID=UPI00234ADD58|nr:hypothetical protein [Aneurinibacillus sp. B1]WCN39022.1 hypothetical protein PO771_06395 [Aneurinibacillus sp. B1]